MYTEVYEEMVKGGNANKIISSVKLSKKGLIVEHKLKPFGMDIKYYLIRQEKLLFLDEVGSTIFTDKGWKHWVSEFIV